MELLGSVLGASAVPQTSWRVSASWDDHNSSKAQGESKPKATRNYDIEFINIYICNILYIYRLYDYIYI